MACVHWYGLKTYSVARAYFVSMAMAVIGMWSACCIVRYRRRRAGWSVIIKPTSTTQPIFPTAKSIIQIFGDNQQSASRIHHLTPAQSIPPRGAKLMEAGPAPPWTSKNGRKNRVRPTSSTVAKTAYFPHPFQELGLDGVPNPNLDSHGHARIY